MENRIKRLYSNLYQLSSACKKAGVEHVVLSPGSRSAPLALTFMRMPGIRHYIINDERSAAYIALGLARQSGGPVAMVCTSGTAALNYAPAMAEAFNQRIPLIALTSDRPEYLQNRFENQTIFQQGIYEPNVLGSFLVRLDTDDDLLPDEAFATISKALNLAVTQNGPVQINLPVDEPFYTDGAQPEYDEPDRTIEIEKKKQQSFSAKEQKELMEKLVAHNRIMVYAGSHAPDARLRRILNKLLNMTDIVFVRDILANIHRMDRAVMYPELVLKKAGDEVKETLKPNVLITFGRYDTSKVVREFFRKYKPEQHWHINPHDEEVDPYFALTKTLHLEPVQFFRMLLKHFRYFERTDYARYYKNWEDADNEAALKIEQKINTDIQLAVVDKIIRQLPKGSVLHCGNSLLVRQANNLGLHQNKHAQTIEVYANRGTSGIDGCLSTAVGAALAAPDRKHIALIGDQSYWYDRNALWNKYRPDNLLVVVFNNGGGKIFERLDGPKKQAEYDEYFVSHVPADIEKDVAAQGVRFRKVAASGFVKDTVSSALKEQAGLMVMECVVGE